MSTQNILDAFLFNANWVSTLQLLFRASKMKVNTANIENELVLDSDSDK
jgi:hypothetical protein